jgi:hypothetical protein
MEVRYQEFRPNNVGPSESFQPEQYDAILGLKELSYGAKVLATAGYRAAADPYVKLPKVRFKPDDVVVPLHGSGPST